MEDLLKRLKAVHVKNQLNSLYLFPADTPTGVISNCVVYKFYEKITTRLGIKKDGVVTGPHSFRRNAITNIVSITITIINPLFFFFLSSILLLLFYLYFIFVF